MSSVINIYGSGSGTLPSGYVYDSGVLLVPEVITMGVVNATPKNQEPNVDTSLGYIRLEFNTDITNSVVELSGFISVTEKDVLY